MEGIIWLAILVIMLVVEILTLGLTTIWFAGGALVAFIASLLGANLSVQIVLFVVVSLAALIATRPLAVKYFNQERVKTNADSVIGETAIVLEEINNLQATGRVQVSGQEWTARALDDTIIQAGAQVLIKEISGVKLMVTEKEKTEE